MKQLITFILLITFGLNSQAQGDGAIQERIKAQKVAFITERLDLSPKEAQQFWPIYNAYETKINGMRKNDLKGVRQAMRRGNLSESEAQKLLDQFMAVEDQLHAAKKQLVKDLGSVIAPHKIIQLKVSEDAFNKKLIEMLQQRRARMQRKN